LGHTVIEQYIVQGILPTGFYLYLGYSQHSLQWEYLYEQNQSRIESRIHDMRDTKYITFWILFFRGGNTMETADQRFAHIRNTKQ